MFPPRLSGVVSDGLAGGVLLRGTWSEEPESLLFPLPESVELAGAPVLSCSAMKKKSSEDQSDRSSNDLLNLKLAYEYTESFVSQCDKNIDDINARLTTFLGFAGILLRFGLSLSSDYPVNVVLKVLVLSLSALSICQSGYALTASGVGSTTKPEVLMSDGWFKRNNVRVQAAIINTWHTAIQELEDSLEKKTDQLNRTIFLLSSAACAFAASEVIMTFFPVCS